MFLVAKHQPASTQLMIVGCALGLFSLPPITCANHGSSRAINRQSGFTSGFCLQGKREFSAANAAGTRQKLLLFVAFASSVN
jgi:hypothetical protein